MCGESEVYCSGWSSSRPFSQDDWRCVGPRVCMTLGHAHQLLWDCRRAWGQVTPTVASKTDEGRRNGTHCHSAPRESRISTCPPGRCFKISKWISSHTVSVLFKLLFLCWAPGWVTVCVSPLGVKSPLPMPQWASWIYPVCFQRHAFWGLLLWCRFQGLGCLILSMNTWLFRKKLCVCKTSSWLWKGGIFVRPHLWFSYCLDVALLSSVGEDH